MPCPELLKSRIIWLSVVCAGLTACGSGVVGTGSSPERPVTLVIGVPHITGQDPLRGLPQAARLISLEGLVVNNDDGRPEGRLAESWTASPDGLTWTIKLRPNAFFHDDTPVDAAAVKASLEQSLASLDRDLTPGLSDIAGIETPSLSTLIIRLRNRSTLLLDDLNTPITKPGPGDSQIGTGPYLTSSSTTNELVMKAMPRYYRGAPQIDQIVWKLYPAVRTAWAAMMRGEIDFMWEVSPDTLEFISNEASVQVFPFLRNYVYGVMFNSKRPVFHDRRIRQALNYAVNRSAIVDQVFKGHGYVANGPAWPSHWAYDSNVPTHSYDPSRAAALLDSANVTVAANSLLADRSPSRLRFTCILPEDFPLWEKMALLVQRDLSEIGIDMQLETMPADRFTQRVVSGDFDAVFSELIAGRAASRQPMFWYSTSGQNFWGYRNQTIDASLDGIRKASSDQEYRDAFRQFQAEMLDDPPAIFLALGENTRAVSRRFQVPSPPNSDILFTIADWHLSSDSLRTTN